MGAVFFVFFRKVIAGQQVNAVFAQLGVQAAPGVLLAIQKVAGVFVDQDKLFGRGQTIGGGGGIPRMGQFAQARDADCVELVKVGGRDR